MNKFKSKAAGRTRPTTSKVKEALFGILGERILGSRFLDLFAGYGGIGIEALRRGAGESVFIESSPRVFRELIENIENSGFRGQARAIRQPVKKALKSLAGENFDFIFIDPPYQKGLEKETLEIISERDILAEGGKIIIEHHHKNEIPERVGRFEKAMQRKYGETVLSFYEIRRTTGSS